MTPGANLLISALSIIQPQPFEYLKFAGRTTNDIGIDVPSFDPSETMTGSIQAVSRTLYQVMGLDWKKNYIVIYSVGAITGVERDSSGDRVRFNGKTFQVLSENDWQPMDGWQGSLCVEIPA